jgi:hypothetical protein
MGREITGTLEYGHCYTCVFLFPYFKENTSQKCEKKPSYFKNSPLYKHLRNIPIETQSLHNIA